MRILYLAQHDLWPLTTGARLRNYHLARALARHAKVTYAGIGDAGSPLPPDSSGFEHVVMFAKGRGYTPEKVIRGITGPTPIPILNFRSDAAAAGFRNLLEQRFDSVQIETVQLASYVPIVQCARPRPAIVSDWHNIESELMWRYSDRASGLRRLVARRTARLLERAEQQLLGDCDVCTVASERERDAALRMRHTEIHVVPNGVDCAYYVAAGVPKNADGQAPLVFVGSMDYHANIDAVLWFMREVWPELSRVYPTVTLTIVGRAPVPSIQALASSRIRVTGTVDDVRPYYEHAIASIAPLRVGSGTRLKILESMAAGVPVISTRMGAEGLDVTSGKNILLADTPGEFIGAITRLQSDAALAKSLAAEARTLVLHKYDWAALGAELYGIHCNAVDRVCRSSAV